MSGASAVGSSGCVASTTGSPPFNSSPVLPPCLRSKSAVSVRWYLMARSSGVRPSSVLTFTSAPLAMSSSTISFRPSKAAKCKGVPPTLFFAFTSTPAAKCCLTASMSPPAIAAINVLSISAFPHPTNSTAAIVASRRCFIYHPPRPPAATSAPRSVTRSDRGVVECRDAGGCSGGNW